MSVGPINKTSHDLVLSLLKSVCHRSDRVVKAVDAFGNVASFASWQQARGLDAGLRARTRGRLWRKTSGALQTGKVTVLEFGVAGGAATRTWLSMVPNPELRWHGFDTFTGLPQAWERGGVVVEAAGTFGADGTPPDIPDPRVTWHVGLVEQTLPAAVIDFAPPLLVLFDLDLYGPTAFALGHLTPQLKRGDLLYFDEAFDPWHERRVIDEFLDSGQRVHAVGSSPAGIMLEYDGPEDLGR